MSSDILIYDSDCPICSTAATLSNNVKDMIIVAWNDELSKKFLDAQFGECPFVMFLISDDKVYAGEDALEYLSELDGTGKELVGSQYSTITKFTSKLTGRDHSDVDNDFSGVFSLTEDAREVVESIRAMEREE